MMRFVFTLLAASLTFAAACSKKSGGVADAITNLSAFRDQMCACRDQACVDGVTAAMTEWSTKKKGRLGQVNEDDQKKLTSISEDMSKCITRITTDTAGAAAGSAGSEAGSNGGSAQGSGADGGSAAMGSGAGSDQRMAHRAGMCPSMVLGAATKAVTQGKAVVVTIESSDPDAIAAIQKRTDESLADKEDAPSNAGGGHDMKGTHGGSQGLCPVYVPDGATAKSKHAAKGVVVTITPKDKLAELATEIDGRIAKAAAWVKANVKDGDKQNQGGVGGGKGEDGSNHSGKGDGKGHERKQGGGSGGGKGTGGGGGSGTGGGSGKTG